MKPLKIQEIRSLSDDELKRKETSLREALFKVRMQLAIGKFTKMADIKVMKKNLARIMTVMHEKKLV